MIEGTLDILVGENWYNCVKKDGEEMVRHYVDESILNISYFTDVGHR